jgi:hypothetical protein
MKKYFNPNNYIKFLLRKFIFLISPLISKWERKYLDEYKNNILKHQPIFIIGAPRTGSTILYQTLTNQLDVLYIDNLTCMFNKNLFFGLWLSNKLFKQKAHNCFKSKLGSTSGFRGPSECGGLWYRWLPMNKHVVESGECSDETIKRIRSEISAVINYYDKPLVIGNNIAGLRIGFLNEVFPDAKYIVIDREPIFVAQSLLLARKYIHGDFMHWWGMKPKNYTELLKESPAVQVVLQHYFTNKQIYQDLKSYVNKANWIDIKYSELSTQKKITIQKIKDLINFYNERDFFEYNEVFENKEIKVDKKLIDQIKIQIEEKNWDDYSSKT